MTSGVPTLKMLAGQVVLNQEPPPLSDDLIEYLTQIVDLHDIVNEPVAIWQDLNGLLNTVLQMSQEDDVATGGDQLQVLRELIARCDRVLQLIQPALEFIDQQPDPQWREYFTVKCTEAIDSVNDCKANCEFLLGNG